MSTTKIVPQAADSLTLDFFCSSCEGLMVPTKTLAGERSLTCCRCGHEVAAATALCSCKVGERAFVSIETAPLRGR